MSGIVVRVNNLLYHIDISVSISVRKVSPNALFDGTDESFNYSDLDVWVSSNAKFDVVLFENVLQNTTNELFSSVGL